MTTKAKDDDNTGCLVVIIIFMLLYALGNIKGCNSTPSYSPPTPPAVESTEDKLRRTYDSRGIPHDEKMIRDDSRAIEQLHREFGK